MKSLEIFCVTNKRIQHLEFFFYNLCWVGKETVPENYLKCDHGDNIFYKEAFYSELTFHYWYWKNLLNLEVDDWVGFCQKRRFWIKKSSKGIKIDKKNFKDHLLVEADNEWNKYDAIICDPISVNNVKKIKMLKRGFKNIIQEPRIFFDSRKQSLKFHFDMHHGKGNIDQAINLLNENDKKDFFNFLENNTMFNPHIMFIAKPKIINNWFNDLFSWLFKCEEVFGFEKLHGYDTTRLYAYLAERYLSFWFRKNTQFLEWPHITLDN